MRPVIAAALAMTLSVAALAQHGSHRVHGPYAGQETRAIKGLSDEDIAELKRGGGWGLARAAELNGYPGPMHVLELGEPLGLTAEQRASVTAIFETMRRRAIAEGEQLIAHEARLEAAFASRRITADSLGGLLVAVERSRASLREIHLAAHLATTPLLSDDQRRRYAALRGYGEDRCAQVPAGHDPVLWRRHNACRD